MSDNSSNYSDSDCTPGSEEEEDLTTYKILYDKKDEYVNLFRDFLPRTVEGFESMVLSTTDIEKLKKNE